MDQAERSLLEALDHTLRSDAVRGRIDAIVEHVVKKLVGNHEALLAWEPIPLYVFDDALPPTIRSSWVFVLRGGAVTGAERHPNSHQRMMSYRGTGDLQTGGDNRWESNRIRSTPDAQLQDRWVSVPPNVWHQAVVPAQDWVVVSFHTVPADELIEERPDSLEVNTTKQRKYVT